MVVKAEAKEVTVKNSESNALVHNCECGSPNQSWTAFEIDDENQHYDPENFLVFF